MNGKPYLYSIGGCAYRMQIDARLAASIAGTAILTTLMSAADDGAPSLMFRGVNFRHTSNLPQGRCLWIQQEVGDRDTPGSEDLDLSVSVDSDCWYRADDLARELLRIISALRHGIADDVGLWTAPVHQGNGACNWRTERGFFASTNSDTPSTPNLYGIANGEDIAEIYAGRKKITATGWGLVILNLKWWREHWPEPVPNITELWTGEDIELCKGMTQRGGRIEPIAVNVEHGHFAM